MVGSKELSLNNDEVHVDKFEHVLGGGSCEAVVGCLFRYGRRGGRPGQSGIGSLDYGDLSYGDTLCEDLHTDTDTH